MAPRDPVKSARRVLEILERFEAEKRPLGVSEIAQVLGYPLSSTSMLLNTLARLGYLNLDPASRKFAPTMSVAMLGDWIVSGDEGRSRVKGVIDDARRLTGLTAVLSTRNGIDVQYVYVLRAPESNFRSRSPGAGTLRPILRSSPGIALMAELDDVPWI
ncbi:MAG TPA: helix-turn-helix domain-containing protein, partial [Quisquiliibacterium sp.]|nr:helix-turn-helix domain-containing protein [Quisquiliibacterium sp.]